jgi:hypothetical protein
MLLALTYSLALLGGAPAGAPGADAPCITMNTENLPLSSRKSPLDSVSFRVGSSDVKVCYGRPSLRGRAVIGGEIVPYGKLWRTGANEPTMLHTSGPLTVAGISLAPGSYSLYTVPGEKEWEIVVNRSTSQWGEEHGYTEEIRAQELGRARVKAAHTSSPVETFTIRAEPGAANASALALEWERARVVIPLAAK